MDRRPARGSSGGEAPRGAFPFEGALSPSAAASVREEARRVVLPAGRVLLSEGQACEALHLVVRGAIRVFKTAPTGREITLYFVRPGDSCVLGASCLLSDNRYRAQAVAASEVEAAALPAALFRRLFASEEAVRRFVVELFSRRLDAVMALVEEVNFRRMDQRLAGFLLAEGAKAPGLYRPVAMSHEEIAGHLGTAREVVSRLLDQFAGERLVTVERRLVRIADPAGLRRLASA